jgi:hypothetical protein
MTEKETLKIVNALMSYYPDTFKDMSDEQTKTFVWIWNKSFLDNSYKEVQAAVMDFIQNSTDSFMPKVGQIKQIINNYRFGNVPNEMEAFEIMLKARKSYNIYDEPKAGDAYDTLPEAIKRAIGGREGFISIGKQNTESTQYGIEKSNFMRIYKTELDRAKQDFNRPTWLKSALEQGIKKYDFLSSGIVEDVLQIAEKTYEEQEIV